MSDETNAALADPLNTSTDILKNMVARMAPNIGRSATAIPGLFLTRWQDEAQSDVCFYAPAIGIILQGRKKSLIGSEDLEYGAQDCLVNGVDMPSSSKILEASPEKPLLAVSLNIDRSLTTELAAEISPPSGVKQTHLGVSVSRVPPEVIEAFVRLVELLDRPEQVQLRAPIIIREIITRVLVSPFGPALRMIYTLGSHSNQVAEAISWLRDNYTQPLSVEALAARVGMPTSTFHCQFKKVTSISPLQYQKCLRLYEAQRLMLTEDMDANNAGRAVGYDNVQQFNREYKRMFGEPPLRDIKRLRKE